jgi:FlaA1/EpsC-like NDP-sugar epimerase
MMEHNSMEAVRNNVLGTLRMVELASGHGVEKFVLISTDKAVRPTSVMGATKRMAELVTRAVGQTSSMRTMAVRFGNVLDSEGSVLPLFRKQIARGGPITLTHPEVTRYFMTIPEASSLVLQAAAFGRGGEVFLLDMGAPVKIKHLAEELITLCGLRPGIDIAILTTGLRKGEKLYEELLADMRTASPTSHPKILVAKREMDGLLPDRWREQLEQMTTGTLPGGEAELRHWIQEWVPDFASPECAVVDETRIGGISYPHLA